MGANQHNKVYIPAPETTTMSPDPDDSARHGREAVKALRQTNQENWTNLADKTALTQRQIAMWELAVCYDLKQMYIAHEYGIKESTVSRHVERVREKADQADEKIQELKEELQQWEETKTYLEA
jgi:DNA-binding NarL/FixJ family response regulator